MESGRNFQDFLKKQKRGRRQRGLKEWTVSNRLKITKPLCKRKEFMSTASRSITAPKSIQELYSWYRDGQLLVNRRYQRKLVWTLEEKQKLINSILEGYPLPLILLAGSDGSGYEIIDGMQRLNAIFSFIETGYSLNNQYFDLNEFAAARQAGEKGLFKPKQNHAKLDREKCAKLLYYQLAVTIFSGQNEENINEVFSRINAGGRQLSSQEKRQAGVVSAFSDLVRVVSSEIRGDTSEKTLKLHEMPMISIETRDTQGYSVNAEDTFWCHHGILSAKQLRESEDEGFVADILASILLESPLNRSKETLDFLYDSKREISQKANKKLTQFKIDFLKEQIIGLFSHIDSTVKEYDPDPKAFRKQVMGDKSTAGASKAPFYAVFMAFYELMIKESRIPADSNQILKAICDLNKKLEQQTHHATSNQRKKNINTAKGLIQDYFVKREPSQLLHGPGLTLDFENSLRRSKIETPRYENKQGFLTLENNRGFDGNLIKKLAQTACGMANIGPDSKGFIHIGVADRREHSERIKQLDSIEPVQINSHWVVGIDREAKLKNKTVEKYIDLFVSEFKKTPLSEDLKSSILSHIDTIAYREFSVIRISVKPQKKISYVGDDCFIREGSHTKKVSGPEMEAVFKRFSRS